MSDIIVVAIISFAGTLLGAYFANQKAVAVMEERLDNVIGRIDSMDERVRQHNNFDSRLSAVEAILKRLEG